MPLEEKDFLRDAVELARRRSRDIDLDDKDQLLDLAAHLFAVALLSLRWGTAGLVRGPDQLESGHRGFTEEHREMLASLPDSVESAELYKVVCASLYGLQQEIPKRLKGDNDLPLRRISLQGHGNCKLSGDVAVWLCPRSDPHRPLRLLRKKRKELADERRQPRRPDLGPHPSRFLDQMGMVWNSDPQQPSVEAWKAPEHPFLVEQSGPDAAQKHGFRVALCPLGVNAHPEFRAYQAEDGDCYFQALGPDALARSDVLHEQLGAVLAAAVAQQVQLLVLPELMVDEPARHHLVQWFKRPPFSRYPYAVVAGSFHLWRDGEDPTVHMPVNESRTLAQSGEVLLRHHKRGRFRIPADRVKKIPTFFPGPHDDCPEGVAEVVEGIRHEASLRMLETTLGRIVVAICADCIAPDRTKLTGPLSRLDPELVIIVSMSEETTEFEELATTLAHGEISSLFVNACCVCDPEKRPVLAGAHLALWEPQGAPPTRVRWRCGEAEPEVRYFHPEDLRGIEKAEIKQQKKGWRPLSDAPGTTGVEWLGGGEKKLGLVVDLGVHWGWQEDS